MDPGTKGSLREYVLLRAIDKDAEIDFLRTLLMAKATLLSVSSSPKDIKEYNKLLSQYRHAVFGLNIKKAQSTDDEAKGLLEKLKGDNTEMTRTEMKPSGTFDENVEGLGVREFMELAKR